MANMEYPYHLSFKAKGSIAFKLKTDAADAIALIGEMR